MESKAVTSAGGKNGGGIVRRVQFERRRPRSRAQRCGAHSRAVGWEPVICVRRCHLRASGDGGGRRRERCEAKLECRITLSDFDGSCSGAATVVVFSLAQVRPFKQATHSVYWKRTRAVYLSNCRCRGSRKHQSQWMTNGRAPAQARCPSRPPCAGTSYRQNPCHRI